ncbi:MAG TPA: hypothetical protein DCP64_04930 [Sarcina sp.]|nr:hypothetical protein [Sarcina sp.]
MFFNIFGVPDHNVLERCKNDANAAGTARSKPGGRICRARNRMTDSFLSQDISGGAPYGITWEEMAERIDDETTL